MSRRCACLNGIHCAASWNWISQAAKRFILYMYSRDFVGSKSSRSGMALSVQQQQQQQRMQMPFDGMKEEDSHLCCIPLSAFASFFFSSFSFSFAQFFASVARSIAQQNTKLYLLPCALPHTLCSICSSSASVRMCVCIPLWDCVCVLLCVCHVKTLRLLPFHSVSFALCGQHVLLKCVSCIAIPCR